MAFGKEVGTYETTATSITKSDVPGGGSQFNLNGEGTVSGGWDGSILLTLTLTTTDFETGTYTSSVAVYLANGDVITGQGTGVFKALGGHQWQLNGTDRVSDGTLIATEGTMALGTRKLAGKIFEIT